MEVGRRLVRHRPPDSEDAGVPQLVDALRAEIESEGRITFARFMQRALYEPGLGYYATDARRPTRAGDFLTAPEMHPIFGHAIARQLDEMWQRLGQPVRFVLREYGAGSGTLAQAVADGLARTSSPLAERLVYEPVELPLQLAALERRFAEAGGGLAPERAVAPGQPMVGCVLANEFVDALPVHRVEQRGEQLRELYVAWRDGRFVEEAGEPSTTDLSRQLAAGGVRLADGQRAEVNLAMGEWLKSVAAGLTRGYALIIDYADDEAELYGPRRTTGTLRAFRGQHVSSDLLHGVGRQDLTATVNLDALERGARAAGLQVLGRTTQAELLVGCGLERLLEQAREQHAQDWHAQLLLRSAIRRLLDPQQLGGYGVVVLGRGVEEEPALCGLGYRLSRRA